MDNINLDGKVIMISWISTHEIFIVMQKPNYLEIKKKFNLIKTSRLDIHV